MEYVCAECVCRGGGGAESKGGGGGPYGMCCGGCVS